METLRGRERKSIKPSAEEIDKEQKTASLKSVRITFAPIFVVKSVSNSKTVLRVVLLVLSSVNRSSSLITSYNKHLTDKRTAAKRFCLTITKMMIPSNE